MFASAEEVTNPAPREDDEDAAPQEDEAKETSEVKVSSCLNTRYICSASTWVMQVQLQ